MCHACPAEARHAITVAPCRSSRGQTYSHCWRSYPGAAHDQIDAITLCPVRESNLGPLCAIQTTLTTQPLRQDKSLAWEPRRYPVCLSYLLVVATTMTINFSGLPISGVAQSPTNRSQDWILEGWSRGRAILSRDFLFHPVTCDMTSHDMTWHTSPAEASPVVTVRESYPGAAHDQKDAITLCPVPWILQQKNIFKIDNIREK